MTEQRTADFRPGAAVLVRAIDAEPGDLTTVVRQLGPTSTAPPSGEPDITIRFVDRLPESGPLRWIDLNDAGATDTEFLVLRGKQHSQARVAVPLDRAGSPLEILCERPVRAVPLLIPLINLAALGHGIVPVHASAVRYLGLGILIVGWSKGGKTETVLSLMGRGAEFVGDEWMYLRPDGRATGLGEPCRIWDWQVAQLPWLANAIGPRALIGLRLMAAAAGTVGIGRRLPVVRGSTVGSVLDRAEPIVRRQASVQVPPERLFPGRTVAEARIDVVIHASSTATPDASLTPIDLDELVERMVQSNGHERLNIVTAAAKFRFAFPDRPTPAIDAATDVERRLLRTALARRPAWRLDHPYPPHIEDLADVLQPALEGTSATG